MKVSNKWIIKIWRESIISQIPSEQNILLLVWETKSWSFTVFQYIQNTPNFFTGVFQRGFAWYKMFVIIKFGMTAIITSNSQHIMCSIFGISAFIAFICYVLDSRLTWNFPPHISSSVNSIIHGNHIIYV